MSKSEDYLDQLLKGVNESEDADTVLEDDFLGEDLLNEDLLDEAFMDGDLSEDFLKEFEMELQGMENSDIIKEDSFDMPIEDDVVESSQDDSDVSDISGLEALLGSEFGFNIESEESNDSVVEERSDLTESVEENTESVQDLFDNLDSIVSGVAEPMDILAAIEESAETEAEAEPQIDDGEADVMKILEGLGDIDLELDGDADGMGIERSEESKANDDALLDFLAGGAMGAMDTAEEAVSGDLSETPEEITDSKDSKKKKKDKKKPVKNGEKQGFMSKLGTLLFGEDDEEEETAKSAGQNVVTEAVQSQEVKIQEFSDDTMDLFKDFTTAPSQPVAEAPAEPEDKKKGKKKKEKVKKEKVKKEKKPKPKKEKKPKKPKEPDNTPPLPKKPVMLIFLMVASLVALIVVGTDLVGYSNSFKDAENAYVKKNYTEAYTYIAGMEIKEKDLALYEKYQTMALIASELDAYRNLMQGEFYDMALDSLIRMVGRCEKYEEDAKIYDCAKELKSLEEEAENILNETFKMTKEEALELYHYRDRRDYSRALNAILKELGMEKVTEE